MIMELQTRSPELEELVLKEVKLTGTNIGAGAYGSVEEVEIPGAVVAAKRLHSQLVDFGSEEQECKLMSKLRHPNIVQFLGVYYLSGSQVPLLVMEKLQTSLDSLLETTTDIPLDVKIHLLKGICQGMVYLHSHNPPIAHRDLTARNILIDSGLTAKIADLGVARMVNIQPGQVAATMTRAPGNGLYMPPEAIREVGTIRYGTSIDIFSFGVICLFTVTQIFPRDIKPATDFDSVSRKIIGLSEIERREKYIKIMDEKLGHDHPLVQLTLHCLQYLPEDRPSASIVLSELQKITPKKSTIVNTKLEIIQETQQMQKTYAKEKCQFMNDFISEIKYLREKNSDLESCNRNLQDTIDRLQAEKNGLFTTTNEAQVIEDYEIIDLTESATDSQTSSKPLVASTISFNWRRCRDIPKGVHPYGQPVLLDEKIFVCAKQSFATGAVLEYSPSSDKWSLLPALSIYNFGIATLNGELLVIGGKESSTGRAKDVILTYDNSNQKWIKSHFVLPEPLSIPLAFEYDGQLLIIGGDDYKDSPTAKVRIFSPTTSKWQNLPSLPGSVHYKQVLISDTLYLISDRGRNYKYAKKILIRSLMSKQNVWKKLAEPFLYNSSPIAIGNQLLTVGGSEIESSKVGAIPTTRIDLFDPSKNEWSQIGNLPKQGVNCCCIVYTDRLFVLGLDGAAYVAGLKM